MYAIGNAGKLHFCKSLYLFEGMRWTQSQRGYTHTQYSYSTHEYSLLILIQGRLVRGEKTLVAHCTFPPNVTLVVRVCGIRLDFYYIYKHELAWPPKRGKERVITTP